MDQVRLGFVGVGNMGQCAHLKHYAALAECEVVALAELRPELARRVAARYGVPRVYPNHRELLAAERLDGIVAIQSFTRHGGLLPELAQAGVPILIEKPLAGSVEVGERIVAAARAAGVWIMVGYHKRSDPATICAREEIERLRQTGELGALRYVRLTMPPGDWIAGGFYDLITTEEPYPETPEDPPPTDLDPQARREYLTFVNYYIHQVNLLRHLLGEPYQVTFADRGGRLLVAETESGVTGIIEMEPYRTTVDWQESALVGFERGYVKLELPAPVALNRPGRVELLYDPGEGAEPRTVAPHLPWESAMRRQASNFLRAIRGEAPPPCEAAEALEDLRVAREYLRLWRGV